MGGYQIFERGARDIIRNRTLHIKINAPFSGVWWATNRLLDSRFLSGTDPEEEVYNN